MAHCPPELLDDLEEVFAALRRLEHVVEKGPAVFYLKRTPFLHFHALATGRAADARDGRDWGTRIPLPYPTSATGRRAFLREIARRHRATAEAFGLALGLGLGLGGDRGTATRSESAATSPAAAHVPGRSGSSKR